MPVNQPEKHICCAKNRTDVLIGQTKAGFILRMEIYGVYADHYVRNADHYVRMCIDLFAQFGLRTYGVRSINPAKGYTYLCDVCLIGSIRIDVIYQSLF